jgi:hypothetical protein
MYAEYRREWLSALRFAPHNYRPTIIMPSTAVSDFWLLRFFHPNSLSVRAIPRIIFFRRLNHLNFNKVVGGPSSIGVISYKNPTPAVLEYAHPEAREAGFST